MAGEPFLLKAVYIPISSLTKTVAYHSRVYVVCTPNFESF